MTTTAEEANHMSAASPRPTLDVANLSIDYRRGTRPARVVHDVSFQIRPGEAYGLVGESGCGKTTVAMSLMRYLPDNAVVDGASRVTFAGEDLLSADEPTLRSWRGNRVAMVYQNPGSALNPSMSIGTQLAEIFRTHSAMTQPEARAAAEAMLAKVRMPDPVAAMARYPHQLSGGQQQRVMIAMALATSPDLLIMDEPTTGLDATVEAEVLDLVVALRAEYGTAVLFISHNLGVVARVCDRVGVLYAGRLIEEGPAERLFKDPRHPYTLGLLRAAPRWGHTKTGNRLDSIPGSLPPLGADLPGCPYASRCAIATDQCHTQVPVLEPVAPGRLARCFHHTRTQCIESVAEAASPTSPATTDVLLRVENLTKRYRSGGHEITAVQDVSFEVHRGEAFALVGESGSGKTTLAKCIVGMLDPSEGTLTFEDVPLTVRARRAQRDTRRKIQMVFQNPDTALNPRHTVGRILRRALSLLDSTVRGADRENRVTDLAHSVRLEDRHLRSRPTVLSGGQKQRAAIARAFAGSPSLVLCDEPVSALDVSVQAAILNLLVDLQASHGVSYIFISHDMAVVRYIADRVGVMYLGQMMETGTADAVFQPPHHPYTEALMSAAPSLDSDDAQERIRLDGSYPNAAAPPSGCRFNTRCPRRIGDICGTVQPPWQHAPGGNTYRCHIAPEELLQIQRGPLDSTATQPVVEPAGEDR
ncbi:ABC transporter ATP-binding protein [Streptomyces sulfonofaciens]|uniref:ABC transporter ATP-binding protein n=1 Tax=Streptomyces sulfonofaciens TaxID=68272 RepID=A0A919GL91_9ACTN|nr:ABC transporter ATP-binding protein [Streptomyces sulfonofaciens]GHH86722.1 ABC transporter ATP-binding protein [Streptomyces sulfonofaciens]